MTYCAYCGVRPVSPWYTWTCAQCVFKCGDCNELTPYEEGMAQDDLCDGCGVKENASL